MNGLLYAPWFIPEQGLQFHYKYLLIRENQKASFGRIKADLVTVLFLRDENNLAPFTFEPTPYSLHSITAMSVMSESKNLWMQIHFNFQLNFYLFQYSLQMCQCCDFKRCQASCTYFIYNNESLFPDPYPCDFDGVQPETP